MTEHQSQNPSQNQRHDRPDQPGQSDQPETENAQQPPNDDVHWIDFRRNEIEDDAYTPVKDNVRGLYLPDQADQVNRAARDDAFHTEGETGLAAGGGTYGAVGAGTSGGTMGRGDTGRFGTMGGTDLSDTLGGPGAPDRTAGPAGTEPLGDMGGPPVVRPQEESESGEE